MAVKNKGNRCRRGRGGLDEGVALNFQVFFLALKWINHKYFDLQVTQN